MKQNYKLLLSYDGSRYFGFERQKDQELTIQGKLEAVLSAMPRNDTEKVETFSAGRTDAGVHARGMCCNVFLDTNLTEEEIQEYCNHYLPEDIGINSVKKASERFHARYLARGKVYRYSCYIGKNKDVFERKYLYHLEEEPDIEEMKRAGAYLVGEKDFKSFSGNPKMNGKKDFQYRYPKERQYSSLLFSRKRIFTVSNPDYGRDTFRGGVS